MHDKSNVDAVEGCIDRIMASGFTRLSTQEFIYVLNLCACTMVSCNQPRLREILLLAIGAYDWEGLADKSGTWVATPDPGDGLPSSPESH